MWQQVSANHGSLNEEPARGRLVAAGSPRSLPRTAPPPPFLFLAHSFFLFFPCCSETGRYCPGGSRWRAGVHGSRGISSRGRFSFLRPEGRSSPSAGSFGARRETAIIRLSFEVAHSACPVMGDRSDSTDFLCARGPVGRRGGVLVLQSAIAVCTAPLQTTAPRELCSVI